MGYPTRGAQYASLASRMAKTGQILEQLQKKVYQSPPAKRRVKTDDVVQYESEITKISSATVKTLLCLNGKTLEIRIIDGKFMKCLMTGRL